MAKERRRKMVPQATPEVQKLGKQSLQLQKPFYLLLIIFLPWLTLKPFFQRGNWYMKMRVVYSTLEQKLAQNIFPKSILTKLNIQIW